ncbi:MAG TPA: 50S ribosomal protein L6 [Deltaproteobacteria bacterium]|nr:50S ribosomal protein L6 [Deltaproteobacteria bacterium]
MSRIGTQPINIPAGVKVAVEGGTVKVSGPLGSLEQKIRDEVSVKLDGNVLTVTRNGDGRIERSLHGLTRTLLANMVRGVAEGFEKKLEIVGVGYKAEARGDVLNLSLGYSHPIEYRLPAGIKAKVERPTAVTIQGADKQLVGQVAAEIRALRKPEPYKGKGVKYADETIARKAGKAGKAGGK